MHDGKHSGGLAADWRANALVTGMLLFVLALEGYGASRLSPTIDEPLHVIRGIAFFCAKDLRLNFAHPPLANAVAAAPMVLTSGCRKLEKMTGWRSIDHSRVARYWVETDYADARAWVVGTRWLSVACVLLLVLFGYRWTTRRYGATAGVACAALLAGSLTLLAHGQVNTTDAPMALCSFMCLCALIDRMREVSPTTRTRVALAAAAAITVSVKHTALPLLIMLALTQLALSVRSSRALRSWALDWGSCAAAAVALICVMYRFEGVLDSYGEWKQRTEPSNWLTGYRPGHFVASSKLLSWLPDWTPMPLPYTYVVGVLTVGAQNAREGSTYFFGLTRGGSVLYFPLLLLLKQPAVIVLAQFGALFTRKRLSDEQRIAANAAWLTAGMFLALSCTSKINIGVRHVLPFIAMACLPAAFWVASLWPRYQRWLLIAAVTLPLSGLYNREDLIGYFNVLAGGRSGGHKIAMIGEDWGQDTGRVALELKSRGINSVHYLSSAQVLGASLRISELRYFGLKAKPAECTHFVHGGKGWALIERTLLYRQRANCHRVIESSTKTEVLFDHWQLFKLRAVPPAPPAAAPAAPAAPAPPATPEP